MSRRWLRHRVVGRPARWGGFLCLLAATGCPPPPPTVVPSSEPRIRDDIIETVNANADRIDRPVYARPVRVAATFADAAGREHSFNLEGSLLIRKPREMRMDLRPALGEDVLRLGTNEDEYWAWILPELKTLWWGRHEHVGESCAKRVPLQPDQLVELLGVHRLPQGGDAMIGPVLRSEERDGPFDQLIYVRPSTDGGTWELQKEYWVERVPPFLVRVVIFRDRFGRRGMNASLDDYQPVWEGGPLAPRTIKVQWPAQRGRLAMTIDSVSVPEAIGRRAFQRPEPPPGIEQVIQVDEDCDAPESSPMDVEWPAGTGDAARE